MAFIELSHIKNILGITDDSEDMRISVILDGILEKVSLLIKRERTKLIPAHNVENFEIPIPCPLISEILTIDGKKYDNVVILENGKIFVENFFPSKKFFEVKFISGVEKCPAKIVSLVASLIELELGKENGKNIVSETLGPRSITYENSESATQSQEAKIWRQINFSLIPPYLRAF